MLTVALIVPPVVIAVLWKNPSLLRSPRALLGSILAAGLPLLAYSYVYLRGAQHPEWWGAGEWQSASQWFLAFISTAQGREELLWGFEPGRSFFGNGFPQLIVSELGWLMLALGLMGIAWLKRPLPFILYSTLTLYLLFSWAYRYGNWFQVILPAYPLILLGAGAAIDRAQSLAQDYDLSPDAGQAARRRRWASTALVAAPLVIVAAAIAWRATASLPAADSRNRTQDTALQHAAVLLDQPLPSNAALFASVDDALALQYLTRIWALRPDRTSRQQRPSGCQAGLRARLHHVGRRAHAPRRGEPCARRLAQHSLARLAGADATGAARFVKCRRQRIAMGRAATVHSV